MASNTCNLLHHGDIILITLRISVSLLNNLHDIDTCRTMLLILIVYLRRASGRKVIYVNKSDHNNFVVAYCQQPH